MASASQHRGVGRLIGIGFGALAAPLAWAFHSLSIVLLVPAACQAGSEWPHLLVTVVASVVSAAGLLVAYRLWRTTDVVESARTSTSGRRSRGGFLALGGVFTSAMFLLLILIESIPLVVLGACETHP